MKAGEPAKLEIFKPNLAPGGLCQSLCDSPGQAQWAESGIRPDQIMLGMSVITDKEDIGSPGLNDLHAEILRCPALRMLLVAMLCDCLPFAQVCCREQFCMVTSLRLQHHPLT